MSLQRKGMDFKNIITFPPDKNNTFNTPFDDETTS